MIRKYGFVGNIRPLAHGKGLRNQNWKGPPRSPDGDVDMQLFIAGGCGDEGRNCFYVEGDRHAFIVDAGTSTDGLDRIPDLTPEQIHKAEYLFITHSDRKSVV